MEYNFCSELLKIIMEKAEAISGAGAASVTAERFLLSVFEGIGAALRTDNGEDLDGAAKIVSEAFSDLGKTQQSLSEYVKKNDYAFIDNLYMEKRLEVAMTLAARRKMPAVSVDVLLSAILIQPSNIINACMKKGFVEKLAGDESDVFEVNKQLSASLEEKLAAETETNEESVSSTAEIIVEQIDMSVVEILAGNRGEVSDNSEEEEEVDSELAERMRAEIEAEENAEEKKLTPEEETDEAFAKVVKAEIEADKIEPQEGTEPTPEEQADEEFAKVVKAEIEADKAEPKEGTEPTPEEQADEAFAKVVKAEIEADKSEPKEGTEPTPEEQADEAFAKVVRAEYEAGRRKEASAEAPVVENVSEEEVVFEAATEVVTEAVAEDTEIVEDVVAGEEVISWSDESEEISRDKLLGLADRIKELKEELEGVVLGQQKAIDVFAEGYFKAELLAMTDKDVWGCATFLLVGPDGVGKRFLAENVARILEKTFIRFDMSEFRVGGGLDGKNCLTKRLIDFISANPRSVVLFDKIEKLNSDAVHTLIQIMDEGMLRDSDTDETIGLGEVIFFLATGAGKQVYDTSVCGDLSDMSKKDIIRALQGDVDSVDGMSCFPKELCTRFESLGNVAMFNRISAPDLCAIAMRTLQSKAECFEEEFGISVDIDERVYPTLVLAEGGEADARAVIDRAVDFFDGEIAELFKTGSAGTRGRGVAELEDIRISIDVSADNAEVLPMYETSEIPEIILFASKKVAQSCTEIGKGYQFHNIISGAKAEKLMQLHEVKLILIDLSYGAKKDSDYVEIRELESSARSFFDRMRESCPDIPVYILQTDKCRLKDEDKLAFERLGASGFMDIENAAGFGRELKSAFEQLRLESGMLMLARSDKKLSFKTTQSLSKDCKLAEIYIYDLEINPVDDDRCSCGDSEAVETNPDGIDDVIGAAEAKAELKSLIEYLKNPKKYLGCGLRAPRGILLYGNKGVGKTTLAHAFASEAEVAVIVADGKALVEMKQERGDENLHMLFRKAKKYAPSVLLIDNVHAIADCSCGDVLAALAQEMDDAEVDATRPVLVLATADMPSIDGACETLLGRFDKCIAIGLPSAEERRALLDSKIWGNKALRISEEVMADLSKRSVGMTIAELEGVVELALRSAVREGKSKVGDDILLRAFESVRGERVCWSDSTITRAAIHVAGHVAVSYACGIIPESVSIAEANSESYANAERVDIVTKAELLSDIRIALSGRAAELACYGAEEGISSLSGADIKVAAAIARKVACEYGMDAGLGLAIFDGDTSLSNDARIAISSILNEQMSAAVAFAKENRAALDALAQALVSKNHLCKKEIEDILKEFFEN